MAGERKVYCENWQFKEEWTEEICRHPPSHLKGDSAALIRNWAASHFQGSSADTMGAQRARRPLPAPIVLSVLCTVTVLTCHICSATRLHNTCSARLWTEINWTVLIPPKCDMMLQYNSSCLKTDLPQKVVNISTRLLLWDKAAPRRCGAVSRSNMFWVFFFFCP